MIGHRKTTRSHPQTHVTHAVVLWDLWSSRSHLWDWQHKSKITEPAGMSRTCQALVWLWGELDRSRCKYCWIRCFSCDNRFISGNKAFCLLFRRSKLKGNCWSTALPGFMSYRCRSALGVLSGTGAFEARGLYRETVISHTGRARLSTVSSENWISIPWD